jgi:hypothetical protein
MNRINKLFVIFIILIFITTPITTNANINQKTNTSSLKISDENSLGTLWITYYPLGKVDIRYEPPDDNPNYDYYFPEDENGFVNPNFTLHVCHRLGSPKKDFPLSKIWPDNFIFTCINIWIQYNGTDIIANENKIVCNTTTFVCYNITPTAVIPVYTNGTTQKCILWITATPLYTNISIIQDICKQIFSHKVVSADIFIHPI